MNDSREKYIPDLSVIVDGGITELVSTRQLQGVEVVVPEVVVLELEAEATNGQETGYKGLNELKKLREFCEEGLIDLKFEGAEDLSPAPPGPKGLDPVIRGLAQRLHGTLITNNKIQASIARSKGLSVQLHRPRGKDTEKSLEGLELLDYFDETTMSVHLRADTVPRAKMGTPDSVQLESISEKKLSSERLEQLTEEIVEVADVHPAGFIEMDSGGASVVQLGNIRIAIAKPPFSDAIEITATRPVKKTTIADYSYSELIESRLQQSHRGVLVAGAPGMGKSTLVQALSEFLRDSGWIVKTMEKPRDLDVSPEISQYRDLNGEMADTAEILLLTRPDYTIFDEMRQTSDFEVFADLRMSGVGLVGVVHATKAIDSLQRLVGRVELGMIPQIVDTVLHVDGGDIKKVFDVEMTVKTPSGMEQGDLSRPVIEVRDFETGSLSYEIYTFGEQVVVIPLEGQEQNRIWDFATSGLEDQLAQELPFDFDLEIRSNNRIAIYVADHHVPAVLGHGGKRVDALEKKVGLHIDVRTFAERESSSPTSPDFRVKNSDEYLLLNFDPSFSNEEIEISINGERVFSGAVSKKGRIKLTKDTHQARRIKKAQREGDKITVNKL
ncbi:Flp pilus assembly complex ATPase component TadA [Candidatus Bipolaricaulota bacterium]|nr:Flp pilus assembly complex ATPase component TadA [Candidatus Bipolaricaulota bacterium]